MTNLVIVSKDGYIDFVCFILFCSLKSKEIISTVARNTDQTSVIAFLCHISQFKPTSTSCPSQPKGGYVSLHPAFSLVYTSVDKEEVLTVRTLTEEEVMELHSVHEMEKVGNGVIALLSLELKHDNLLGLFFIHCLQHLASVLSIQTRTTIPDSGLNDSTRSVHRSEGTETKSSLGTSVKPTTTFTNEQGNSQTSIKDSSVGNSMTSLSLDTQSTSSILLECESKLPPSRSEAYSNSLVLYITASICESLSSSLLEQTELPDLLSALATVISCHAHFVTRPDKKTDTLLFDEESSLDDILGGPITLSIAFGLLSTIMGGVIEVGVAMYCLVCQRCI